MPSDFIIKTGDMIKIDIFPPAIVPALLAPIPLVGTSRDLVVNNMPACLDGDELPPALRAPLPYTAPPFVTPGLGLVSVVLTPTNKTAQTSDGRAILIKGATFLAELQVTVPAMQPTPGGPVPDPVLKKPGTATFITTNAAVRAG
jgi:hypothetical protein